MKHLSLALLVVLLASFTAAPAQADPSSGTVVIVECAATAAGAAVCVPVALLVHELAKLGNGEDAFGPNGEAAKLVTIPVRNFEAARHERGEIAQLVRATVGISVKDIEKHGLFGGPNSFFRKPLG